MADFLQAKSRYIVQVGDAVLGHMGYVLAPPPQENRLNLFTELSSESFRVFVMNVNIGPIFETNLSVTPPTPKLQFQFESLLI